MSRPRGAGVRRVPPGVASAIVDVVVIMVALVLVSFGCAERSRVARCACVVVLVAATGWLAVRQLHPRYALPAIAAYAVVAVALEWRRDASAER